MKFLNKSCAYEFNLLAVVFLTATLCAACSAPLYLNTNKNDDPENLSLLEIRNRNFIGLRIDGSVIGRDIHEIYLKPGKHIFERDQLVTKCRKTKTTHIIYYPNELARRTGTKINEEFRTECANEDAWRILKKGEFTLDAGKKYDIGKLDWGNTPVTKKISLDFSNMPNAYPKGYLWDIKENTN